MSDNSKLIEEITKNLVSNPELLVGLTKVFSEINFDSNIMVESGGNSQNPVTKISINISRDVQDVIKLRETEARIKRESETRLNESSKNFTSNNNDDTTFTVKT